MIEIIADRDTVWVLPRSQFEREYDSGFRFDGFRCHACKAWHFWQGQGPSPCLSETLLRQQPPQAKGALSQQALNADWYLARKLALLQDARAVADAARKAGHWQEANAMTLASYRESATLEARMEEAIRKAAKLLTGSVRHAGYDFRTARPYWVGHVLGESWCLWPKPGDAYRTEQLRELITRRTGCSSATASRIVSGTLQVLRETAR